MNSFKSVQIRTLLFLCGMAVILIGGSMLLVGCSPDKELHAAQAANLTAPATAITTMQPKIHRKLLLRTPPPTPLTPYPTEPPYATPTLDSFEMAQATYEAGEEATWVARMTAVALTPTVPHPTWPPYQTPEPVDLPVGILGERGPGMHVCYCKLENLWRGKRQNGYYIVAYAGRWKEEVQGGVQGIVAVAERTPNYLGFSGWEVYRTPAVAGSVRITAYNGLQITLTSTSGQQFIFDTEARSWVSP